MSTVGIDSSDLRAWRRHPMNGPRDAEHAYDWLYERAEDTYRVGLTLDRALQAVRDGYSSAEMDRIIAADREDEQ